VKSAILTAVSAVIALTAFAGGVFVAQGQTLRPVREQLYFTEEQPLQHPTTLSPDVLKVLLERKEVKEGMRFANSSEWNDPAKLFHASEVHLDGSDEIDLVVIGIRPLSRHSLSLRELYSYGFSDDNGWFWVVGSARKNPKVILFAGCNSLEVMNSRTNGYRDIAAWSPARETTNTIYHFDSKEYKAWKVILLEVHPTPSDH
jgi:hypothetical protein